MIQPEPDNAKEPNPSASPDSPSAETPSAARPLGAAPGSGLKPQHDHTGTARSRTRRRAPRTKIDVTLPGDRNSAEYVFGQEYSNVEGLSYEQSMRAGRWDLLASWLRVIVTLTASVSALSVFADSKVMAAVFATITALVSAVNAGFNPPERAKAHRDAARAYGHLMRPLYLLWYKLYSSAEISPEKYSELWTSFLELEQQVERINESAPPVYYWRKTASGHQDAQETEPPLAA
jgi:hypothetical protein